jgi:hypothetical protein
MTWCLASGTDTECTPCRAAPDNHRPPLRDYEFADSPVEEAVMSEPVS